MVSGKRWAGWCTPFRTILVGSRFLGLTLCESLTCESLPWGPGGSAGLKMYWGWHWGPRGARVRSASTDASAAPRTPEEPTPAPWLSVLGVQRLRILAADLTGS